MRSVLYRRWWSGVVGGDFSQTRSTTRFYVLSVVQFYIPETAYTKINAKIYVHIFHNLTPRIITSRNI